MISSALTMESTTSLNSSSIGGMYRSRARPCAAGGRRSSILLPQPVPRRRRARSSGREPRCPHLQQRVHDGGDENLAAPMRLPVGGVALPRLGAREVDRAAQPAAALSPRLGAELLRERKQRRVSKRVLGDRVSLSRPCASGLPSSLVTTLSSEKTERRATMSASASWKAGWSGSPGSARRGRSPSRRRVSFVCDDVVRETGLELGATIQREIAEEDGAVLGRVVGVQLREGSGDQNSWWPRKAHGTRRPRPSSKVARVRAAIA